MSDDWKYEHAQDLERSLLERLRRFPREPDMLSYGIRSLAAIIVRAWLRIYHRFEVAGLENLPRDGSYVLVANHASHLDTICLVSALPLSKLHRVFPAAAADYFFKTPPRIWIAAVLVNALPFARETHIRQSLELCRELLSNSGNVLIIFPEGTRTKTGQMAAFRSGIGMLVAGKEIPVVPCYLEGAFDAWGKGRLFPRPRKLRLKIGRPQSFADLPTGSESARQIASQLQASVESLRTETTA